ncbi:PGPGW domain-containing protein [uncultured Nitrosomonas sp.]|uniref:PGPGW domain-containing protein n=1 Tax=uncultured Nitrosomonas sp. TaxID=156424 RepID=UPI0025CE0C3E|nr:PGPGW domain-containing protein [uncultured Nitrosomonas sp.]
MLENIVATIDQWISIDVLIDLTIASIIGFIASLVAIPWILIRLPSDYFDLRVPRHWMKDHHPVLRIIGRIIKNMVGFVFLLAGFLMLFLPGQGLLTILIGISCLDFPNKRRLEAKIIGQPALLNIINALRHKFSQPPLTLSSDSQEQSSL